MSCAGSSSFDKLAQIGGEGQSRDVIANSQTEHQHHHVSACLSILHVELQYLGSQLPLSDIDSSIRTKDFGTA